VNETPHSSAERIVCDLVARADRRRRARAAVRVIARVTVWVAGGTLVLALLSRWLAWPSVIPLVALGSAAVALAGALLLVRRPRALSDAVAARVDADAGLAGELRSAYWFAATGPAPTPEGGTGAAEIPWREYHLDRAAVRASGVDVTSLYPPARTGRLWAVALGLALAAAATSIVVPVRARGETALIAEALADSSALDAMPPELRRQLEELLAAMRAGKISAADARKSLDQLENVMAGLDPKLRDKLAELAQKNALGKESQTKRRDLDEEDQAARAEREANSGAGLPEDVKWALDDLAARLANESASRTTNENNPAASSQTGDVGKGSQQAAMSQATAAEASMQLMREAATDPGAAQQMMMGGGGMMGGDSRAGAGGNSGAKTGNADPTQIAQALRRELIEASSDTQGANVNTEDIRRKTEQGHSTLGFTRVAPSATFDRSRAVAPPAVPEARRPLLLNYFIRQQR
jgi:hypothetical protein